MAVDRRQAVVGRAVTARTFGCRFGLGALEGKVNVPLRSWAYHDERAGTRRQTVQVDTDRDGRLSVSVVTDVADPFKAPRTTYQPLRDDLAIDLALRADCVIGLSTRGATDDGA